jgi:Ca-activated chloride channel family protein
MRCRFSAILAVFLMLFGYFARPARADGLIVIVNPPPTVIVRGHFTFAPLEVRYHHVDCAIRDQLAVTSVDQEFYNPNGVVLEGEYIFPIPENAQINKFAIDIDGQPVQAELLPADKARSIYNEIVRKAKDPALLEYAGRAMFKVHIFPIPANGTKHISLKYTEFLKQNNGLLDYHYTLNTEKYSSKPLENVSIKVAVKSTDPITTLYSPTHEVDISRHGDTEATVGYESKNIRPDTDFHLYIGRKSTPLGISLLTYRPDPDKEGYFVLLAAPTLSKNAKPQPKDVVFIMDTSGSMAGAKIEQTRKALTYCVNTLNSQDRFDIVRFSTEAEPLFNGLQDANDANRKKALDFAQGLSAAGGTAIDDALQAALHEREVSLRDGVGEAKNPDRLFLIVFMTDGQPTVGETNPDTILAHWKAQGDKNEAYKNVRVFTFGVGTDVNTRLLDLLADQTRGYSQYVLPNENLELSMSNFWGKVQDPVLANLKLDTGSVAISKSYPRDLPDLFKGEQLVLFGTYTKSGSTAVTISGNVGGQSQKFSQDVAFADKTDNQNEWIAKLWATRRVGYLLDEIRLHNENQELKDEIVALARRFGVVTPYTAMLIIEDENRRGVPVAQRSLREMEYDRGAFGNSSVAIESLRRKDDTGAQAVANSVNSNAYKQASNLSTVDDLAAQSNGHFLFENQPGAAMAKSASAPSAAPVGVSFGGTGSFGGQGGLGGGRGFGGAPPPAVTREQLNLGTASVNGWQVQNDAAKDSGYRAINNYAQQSRVINNRSFFLNGNQWTDIQVQQLKDAKPVKIAFNSDAYFDLLKRFPDAAQYLALGNNLTLELGGAVYEITEEEPAPQAK